MARSRDSGAKFDSFPFLNVMVGMIVVMLLFIFFILSTRVMEAQEAAAIAAELGGASTEQGASDAPATGSSDGAGELEESEYNVLRSQIEQVAGNIAGSRARLDELVRARLELEGLLASKEDAALLAGLDNEDAGKSGTILGEPDPTIFVPDSTVSVTKKPRFVEVSAEAYTIHLDTGASRHPVDEIKQRSSPLAQQLARVDQSRGSEYLLLLVHPNGAEALRAIRKYLLETHQETTREPGPIPGTEYIITKCRIDIGTEPFSREWLLVKDRMAGK